MQVMAPTPPLAVTASLASRSANIPTMPFWVSGSISDEERNILSTFDAMPMEVCCAFTMSDEGYHPACKVGMDAYSNIASAFLLVRLHKSFEHGNRAVIKRVFDVMPDVRVFYGDVYDGRRMESRQMLLRGDETTVMLGGDATFSIEGSFFKPCLLRMRFSRIPQKRHTGSMNVDIKIADPLRSPALRMGDLQHFAIQRSRATLDAADVIKLEKSLVEYTNATSTHCAPYGMPNNVLASQLGVRYFMEGRACTMYSGEVHLQSADLQSVYSAILRSFCTSPPPHEMMVESVETALSHAMDIVHCPSRWTSAIPWDVLDIHKAALERDACAGSLASVGLLLSMHVKRPLRCFPHGIVYHHTQNSVDHKLESMVALMLQMSMHARGLWVLPLQMQYERRPLPVKRPRYSHVHGNAAVADILICPPGGVHGDPWSDLQQDCTRSRMDVEMFSPVPLSMKAHLIALLAATPPTTVTDDACVDERIAGMVVPNDPDDPGYVSIHVQLIDAETPDQVIASNHIRAHRDWLNLLSSPMNGWERGMTDLLLVSVGCLATFPCEERVTMVDMLQSSALTLRRVDPQHYVFERTSGGEYPPTSDEENSHLYPWIFRGMMHVTPCRALTLTDGEPPEDNSDAQIQLFDALIKIIGDTHETIRMIRLDVPITLHKEALPVLCHLLCHPQLVVFQARCLSFDTTIPACDLYATFSASCNHLLYVEFGVATVTVNVRAQLCPREHRLEGIYGQILQLRDAAVLFAHLTDQQRNHAILRDFLKCEESGVEPGLPSFARLWKNAPKYSS